jgi:hypothetical protein
MPQGDVGQNNFLNGVYALHSAPSDPSRIYMAYSFPGNTGGSTPGRVYVSKNSGAAFVRGGSLPGGPFQWASNDSKNKTPITPHGD